MKLRKAVSEHLKTGRLMRSRSLGMYQQNIENLQHWVATDEERRTERPKDFGGDCMLLKLLKATDWELE